MKVWCSGLGLHQPESRQIFFYAIETVFLTITSFDTDDPQSCVKFGEAFELGRHEWFPLRRLITNSRSSAYTGVFWNRFLKETSQQDGRTKNWTMKRQLHATLRLKNSPTGEQIQNGRPTDEITRDPITPLCGPPLFCPCFSLAEPSVLKIS